MKIFGIAIILICLAHAGPAQTAYKLAPPLIRSNGVFFKDFSSARLIFEEKDCIIRYSLDGSEPGEKSARYKDPVRITQNCQLKARSFGPGYLPSETETMQFFKQGIPITVTDHTAPNPKYSGAGPKTLTDHIAGSTNHASSAWLGYETDSIVVTLQLETPTLVNSVLIHTLQNHGAWIFPPERIKVLGNPPGAGAAEWLNELSFTQDSSGGTTLVPLQIPLKSPTLLQGITLIIYPVTSIPQWHPGSGKHGWCFIDEIKLY